MLADAFFRRVHALVATHLAMDSLLQITIYPHIYPFFNIMASSFPNDCLSPKGFYKLREALFSVINLWA